MATGPRLTAQELRLQKMVEEVRSATGVEVLEAAVGMLRTRQESAKTVFEWLARHDVRLAPSFRPCFFRFSNVVVHWRATGDEPQHGGEASLYNLYDALVADSPKLSGAGTAAAERALLHSFRPIDDHPFAGEGTLVALRLEEGVDDPHLWLYRQGREPLELHLDYCGYLEALSLTKGFYRWQLLFADVDFGTEEYARDRRQIAAMLELLPRLFPGHDYGPLVERLKQRSKR